MLSETKNTFFDASLSYARLEENDTRKFGNNDHHALL